jgi:hypothetical protein
MAAETKKEIGLEIGHVLFIDIVDYSKLLIAPTCSSDDLIRHGLPPSKW